MKRSLCWLLLIVTLAILSKLLWAHFTHPAISLHQPAGVQDIRPFDGKEVTLEGYWSLGFEVSGLGPHRKRREPGDIIVWVECADYVETPEWILWLQTHTGKVRVHGVLHARSGGSYGHMGAYDAEIVEASVAFGLAQRLALLLLLTVLLIAILMSAAKSPAKKTAAS